MTLQAQGSVQSIKNKLNMGARDSSFMNRVSFLAKWLFQSIMAFIIFKLMHSFSNQRFMQKSVLNASRSLTVKDHTLTGLCDVILTRSGSLDTGYRDLDDATSSEGR